MQGLHLDRTCLRGAPVLRVAGRLDPPARGDLMESLEALAGVPTRLGLDLSGVDSIDAGSVRALASLRHRLLQEGRHLDILEASPPVREVFAGLGLASLLLPLPPDAARDAGPAQVASARSEPDLQTARAQPEALLYTDSAWRIVEANPAAERLFGIPKEELVGLEASAILGSRASGSEVAGPAEFEFRARDGTTFSGETIRVPVDDSSGAILGTLWMISDVSARRRAELRLVEARRHVAASREAERGALARQLHDGPVQDLIALSYQLAHIARSSPEAGRMRGQVLEVVQRLRSLIGELRPPGLAELGLEAALEGLVLRLQPGLPRVDMDLRDGGDLPEATAVCVFRVVQEALQNVSRHAEARRVHVRLWRAGEQVELSVRDDGRGFQVPDSLQALAWDRHFGLLGLAERAELARGTLVVRSEPGCGTELRLTLPVGAPADA